MRVVLKSSRIGLISDTHNLLRPEALDFLKGCDAIIHCGDICDAQVLTTLAKIAPVTAVRGNNDRGAWAETLSAYELVPIGEVVAYVVHDLSDMDIDPVGAGVSVVLSGHSHRPSVTDRDGVLYVNPGSAGPRRFKLPITLGELEVTGTTVTARIVDLEMPSVADS